MSKFQNFWDSEIFKIYSVYCQKIRIFGEHLACTFDHMKWSIYLMKEISQGHNRIF